VNCALFARMASFFLLGSAALWVTPHAFAEAKRPPYPKGSSEGCDFTPTTECDAAGKCVRRPTDIARFIGVVSIPRAKDKLRVCFGEGMCLDSTTTVRRSSEGDYIATAIFLNPRNLGGVGTKFFASFSYSAFSTIQSRGVIYLISQENTPSIFLSSNHCGGAG
jgi:hypothetical protein